MITLHCPLTPATQGIISRDTIARMKDGVIILNNGRGPLIVEEDLAQALADGKVFAAGPGRGFPWSRFAETIRC